MQTVRPEKGEDSSPDAIQKPPVAAPAASWARLIALPPHSMIGVLDLRLRMTALGKDLFQSYAQISSDARIRSAARTYTRSARASVPSPRLLARHARRHPFAPRRCKPALVQPTRPTPLCACSGEHCKISRSDEDHDIYLYDLSSNGTYVNGTLVGKDGRKQLRSGDTITLLGPAKPSNYQFLFQDLRPPPPAPEAELLQDTSFYASSSSEDHGSASHYDEVCELGRGAFAVVKKVVHRRTGRPFAMKVMEKRKLLGQLRRKSGVQVQRARGGASRGCRASSACSPARAGGGAV